MIEILPLYFILIFVIIRIEWLGGLHFKHSKNIIDIVDSLENRIVKLEKNSNNVNDILYTVQNRIIQLENEAIKKETK